MCDFLLLLEEKKIQQKKEVPSLGSQVSIQDATAHTLMPVQKTSSTWQGGTMVKREAILPGTRKCGDSLSHAAAIMDGLAWDGSMLFRVLTGIWTWHLAIPNEEWRAVTGLWSPLKRLEGKYGILWPPIPGTLTMASGQPEGGATSSLRYLITIDTQL